MESNKPKQRTIRWEDELAETSSHSSDESGIEHHQQNSIQELKEVNICMLQTTPAQKLAQDTQTISSKKFESNSEITTSQNNVK